GVPVAVDRIVRRCLEKDPALRYRSARDLAFQLESISQSSLESAAVPTATDRPRGRKRLPWAAAGVLLVASAFLLLAPSRLAPAGTARPAAHGFVQVTDLPGRETYPDLSPDGKTAVYVYRDDIWSKRVDGLNATNLSGDPASRNTQPAYSPDGSTIAFRSERNGGGIFVMGATGESVRRLTDAGYNPAWTPDGKRIVYATATAWNPFSRGGQSEIWDVAVLTGERRRLFEGDGVQPSVSPHGLRIAYWSIAPAGKADVWT